MAVPAESHLDTDRDRNCFDHGLHQLERAVDVAHHASTRTRSGDPIDGATHVNINSIDAQFDQQLSGIGHDFRFAAKNLDGKWTIFGMRFHHLHGAFIPAGECS